MFTVGGVVLAIGGLYFGQDIFIPFALAILLSFALTPLVNWLRRLRLPRIAAVIVAVTLAFILIGGIAFVVGRQVVQLANNLPSYQTTITEEDPLPAGSPPWRRRGRQGHHDHPGSQQGNLGRGEACRAPEPTPAIGSAPARRSP